MAIRRFRKFHTGLCLAAFALTIALHSTSAVGQEPATEENSAQQAETTEQKSADQEEQEQAADAPKADEPETQKPAAAPKEFVERFNQRALREKPLIGDSIKDLKAYDENGDRFDLNDRNGKHAVVVFGCLT